MRYLVVILQAARQDIEEAARWYNQRGEGLGKRFTKEVRETVKFIKKNPKASSIRYDNIRTTVLSVFPFIIHYYIDEVKQKIIIISVLHSSRNPDIWLNRK